MQSTLFLGFCNLFFENQAGTRGEMPYFPRNMRNPVGNKPAGNPKACGRGGRARPWVCTWGPMGAHGEHIYVFIEKSTYKPNPRGRGTGGTPIPGPGPPM